MKCGRTHAHVKRIARFIETAHAPIRIHMSRQDSRQDKRPACDDLDPADARKKTTHCNADTSKLCDVLRVPSSLAVFGPSTRVAFEGCQGYQMQQTEIIDYAALFKLTEGVSHEYRCTSDTMCLGNCIMSDGDIDRTRCYLPPFCFAWEIKRKLAEKVSNFSSGRSSLLAKGKCIFCYCETFKSQERASDAVPVQCPIAFSCEVIGGVAKEVLMQHCSVISFHATLLKWVSADKGPRVDVTRYSYIPSTTKINTNMYGLCSRVSLEEYAQFMAQQIVKKAACELAVVPSPIIGVPALEFLLSSIKNTQALDKDCLCVQRDIIETGILNPFTDQALKAQLAYRLAVCQELIAVFGDTTEKTELTRNILGNSVLALDCTILCILELRKKYGHSNERGLCIDVMLQDIVENEDIPNQQPSHWWIVEQLCGMHSCVDPFLVKAVMLTVNGGSRNPLFGKITSRRDKSNADEQHSARETAARELAGIAIRSIVLGNTIHASQANLLPLHERFVLYWVDNAALADSMTSTPTSMEKRIFERTRRILTDCIFYNFVYSNKGSLDLFQNTQRDFMETESLCEQYGDLICVLHPALLYILTGRTEETDLSIKMCVARAEKNRGKVVVPKIQPTVSVLWTEILHRLHAIRPKSQPKLVQSKASTACVSPGISVVEMKMFGITDDVIDSIVGLGKKQDPITKKEVQVVVENFPPDDQARLYDLLFWKHPAPIRFIPLPMDDSTAGNTRRIHVCYGCDLILENIIGMHTQGKRKSLSTRSDSEFVCTDALMSGTVDTLCPLCMNVTQSVQLDNRVVVGHIPGKVPRKKPEPTCVIRTNRRFVTTEKPAEIGQVAMPYTMCVSCQRVIVAMPDLRYHVQYRCKDCSLAAKNTLLLSCSIATHKKSSVTKIAVVIANNGEQVYICNRCYVQLPPRLCNGTSTKQEIIEYVKDAVSRRSAFAV